MSGSSPPSAWGDHSIGPYQVLASLGSARCAEVFRVQRPGLLRPLMLELFAPLPPAARAGFLEQARRASRLEHPHLVGCFDLGEDGRGRVYLVRELAEVNLAERLEGGPLPLAQAQELLSQLAEAVAFAREEGVAPVGLDPRNVVYAQGLPKLADLGLVHAHRGLGAVPDARADAHALGVLLYQTLTGETPRGGVSLQGPSRLRPEVPQALDDLCLRALDPEPGRILTSAREFFAELRAVRFEEEEQEDEDEAEGADPVVVATVALTLVALALLGLSLVLILASGDPPAPTPGASLAGGAPAAEPSEAPAPPPATSPAPQEVRATPSRAPSGEALSEAERALVRWDLRGAEEALLRAPRGPEREALQLGLTRARAALDAAERGLEAELKSLRAGEALEQVERLLAEHPDAARLHLFRSHALNWFGRFGEAAAALAEAQRLSPNLRLNELLGSLRELARLTPPDLGPPPFGRWQPYLGGLWSREGPDQVRGYLTGVGDFGLAGLLHREAGARVPPYRLSVELELDCSRPRAFAGLLLGVRDSGDAALLYVLNQPVLFDRIEPGMSAADLRRRDGRWPKALRWARLVNGRWRGVGQTLVSFPDEGWVELSVEVEGERIRPSVDGKPLDWLPLPGGLAGRVGVLKFYSDPVGFRGFRCE